MDEQPNCASVLENLEQQGKFLARVSKRRDLVQKVSWVEASWVGGTKVRIEEERAKELESRAEFMLSIPASLFFYYFVILQALSFRIIKYCNCYLVAQLFTYRKTINFVGFSLSMTTIIARQFCKRPVSVLG